MCSHTLNLTSAPWGLHKIKRRDDLLRLGLVVQFVIIGVWFIPNSNMPHSAWTVGESGMFSNQPKIPLPSSKQANPHGERINWTSNSFYFVHIHPFLHPQENTCTHEHGWEGRCSESTLVRHTTKECHMPPPRAGRPAAAGSTACHGLIPRVFQTAETWRLAHTAAWLNEHQIARVGSGREQQLSGRIVGENIVLVCFLLCFDCDCLFLFLLLFWTNRWMQGKLMHPFLREIQQSWHQILRFSQMQNWKIGNTFTNCLRNGA